MTPSEIEDLYEEVQKVSLAAINAARIMYYAHHEWPGWGTELLPTITETLNTAGAVAERLEQFAADHGASL